MKSQHLTLWSGKALPSTGTVTSDPISIEYKWGYAVQVVWSGTPTGALTLEGSCDNGSIASDGSVSGISNWTTITNSSVSTGGTTGTALYNISDVMYNWFRLVYTASSSTGSASATANIKGS